MLLQVLDRGPGRVTLRITSNHSETLKKKIFKVDYMLRDFITVYGLGFLGEGGVFCYNLSFLYFNKFIFFASRILFAHGAHTVQSKPFMKTVFVEMMLAPTTKAMGTVGV